MEILKWKMKNGLLLKEEIRRKYREGGKNWAAICKSSYGHSIDRNFLGREDFPFIYDFGIVSEGDILELAYDEYIGGNFRNNFKSWRDRDTIKNREYFLVLGITDDEVAVYGGFPQFESVLSFKQSEKNKPKKLEIF
jgi:hypothetical protein